MTADRPNRPENSDDPTRALDDFVRRMRPEVAADAPAPDLSDLVSRLQTERSPGALKPRGGTLRNGQTWDADDVQDVPVVELPRAPSRRADEPDLSLPRVDLRAEGERAAEAPELQLPPVPAPAPPDQAAIEITLRETRDLAAAQWQADREAQAVPAWQPELPALQRRPAGDPRLLATWQPEAWIGAVRQVLAAGTEFVRSADGHPTVQTWPPQHLLLLWPPLRPESPQPGRWPQWLKLSGATRDQAPAELLAELPASALLWLDADGTDIDWALAAEAVLLHEPALRPHQIEGLRAFMASEREAVYARLNTEYSQGEPGGGVFRD